MDIQVYYDSGKMPLKYYNQLNGKSAQENYKNARNEIYNIYFSSEYENIKAALSGVIESAVDDIISGFKLR